MSRKERVTLGVIVAGATWALPVLAEAAPSTSTATQPLGNPVTAVVNVIVVLILILALAVFSIRFLARRSRVASKGSIRVLAARQIAPNRSVQVIALEDKRFLIGVGTDVTLLADVTDDYPELEPNAGFSAAQGDFSAVLSQTLQSVRNRYKGNDSRKESE